MSKELTNEEIESIERFEEQLKRCGNMKYKLLATPPKGYDEYKKQKLKDKWGNDEL